MKISLQMYSVRHALTADYQGTVGRLAAMGCTALEAFSLVEQREQLERARREHGVSIPSAHQSFLAGGDFTPALEAAAAVGATYLIDPHVPEETWQDAGRVRALADRLNERSAQAADHGIVVGYHNHDHELSTQLEGRSALELFADHLDPRVVLEVDTYWAAVGGAGVGDLLASLGDRARLVHLKDGDLRRDPAGQLPLGEGRMPLGETLAAASAVEWGVIEFDEYDGDIFDGVAASLAYLREHA